MIAVPTTHSSLIVRSWQQPMSLELPDDTMNEPILHSPRVQPEDMLLGLDQDDASDSLLYKTSKKEKESNEEITIEQARALCVQFDCDGSRLTPNQRRVILMRSFAWHLRDYGMRSPRYYEDKSQCISAGETAWPGAIGYVKANRLKRGYIEPKDLIERLRKLKPSDNFELRQYYHPQMSGKPSPLREEAYTIGTPEPFWLMLQRSRIWDMARRLGRGGAERVSQEISKRWREVTHDIEQALSPDLHVLRDMGHSPGGTIFPTYLVKGLGALRTQADRKGGDYYDEEYEKASKKKEERIDHWRECNPDTMLADDPVSLYRTWPADLMNELDEIDREAVRRGRKRYIDLLKETEERMQRLISFWRACGLVTGQMTPPTPGNLKGKLRRLKMPSYLEERLDAIATEHGRYTEQGEKWRMIEISRWMEAILNTDIEPSASDTPLPESLLGELDVVWQGVKWSDLEVTQDGMITRIGQWRKSRHGQNREEIIQASPQLISDTMLKPPGGSRQENSGSDVAAVSEETQQAPERSSKGAPRRPRTKIVKLENHGWTGRLRSSMNLEHQTIWHGGLRSRPNAVDTSGERLKVVEKSIGKPTGIKKQYRREALAKKRQVFTKRQTIPTITQNPDPSHLSDPQSRSAEASLQTTPTSIKSENTQNMRRRSPRYISGAQLQGVQKAYMGNNNEKQTRKLTTAALMANPTRTLLLTPPRS